MLIMSDNLVKPDYRHQHSLYGNERVVAPERQISDAFARYERDMETIDATRKLDATEKVGTKLGVIRKTLPNIEDAYEISHLLGHATLLGNVLKAQRNRINSLLAGRDYSDLELGHLELTDFLECYIDPRDRLTTDVIRRGILERERGEELKTFLSFEEALNGERQWVIPLEKLRQFRELFEKTYFGGRNGQQQETKENEAKKQHLLASA